MSPSTGQQADERTIRLSHDEWLKEAEQRCKQRMRDVRFVCPSCHFIQSGEDFLALGMPPEDVASRVGFSCIGRWIPQGDERTVVDAFIGPPGPCNYAGAGLIRIAPVIVVADSGEHYVFDFADDPLTEAGRLAVDSNS